MLIVNFTVCRQYFELYRWVILILKKNSYNLGRNQDIGFLIKCFFYSVFAVFNLKSICNSKSSKKHCIAQKIALLVVIMEMLCYNFFCPWEICFLLVHYFLLLLLGDMSVRADFNLVLADIMKKYGGLSVPLLKFRNVTRSSWFFSYHCPSW